MKKFLQLSFLPRSADFGLLLLRIVSGGGLLYLHGWSKLAGFSRMSGGFPDPLGVGSTLSLILVIFAEVLCAALVVIGLYTRLAALVIAIEFGVVFALVHKFALTGPGSGEVPLIYFSAFLVLLFTGAGKYSVDRQ